jgi:hypothetical protein
VLEELGSDAHVFFPVEAPRISSEGIQAPDDDAALLVEAQSLFNARVDARTRARVGSPLRLAVDPERFHFFDSVTGTSLLGGPSAAEEPDERLAATVR